MDTETPRLTCDYCGEPLVEIHRNFLHVFYTCGCKNFDRKVCDHDYASLIVGGVEYQVDPKNGCIVHECPSCRARSYRERLSTENCLKCGTRLVPRTIDKNKVSAP